MLLAKDLSNKYSFPILIVRPKAMLSNNYVHVPAELEVEFQRKYGPHAKIQYGSTKHMILSRNYSKASDILLYVKAESKMTQNAGQNLTQSPTLRTPEFLPPVTVRPVEPFGFRLSSGL